jgi:hypothetical protein
LHALVESLLGDHRTDGDVLGARQIAFRKGKIGPRLSEARLCLRERRLERPRSIVNRRSPFFTIWPS